MLQKWSNKAALAKKDLVVEDLDLERAALQDAGDVAFAAFRESVDAKLVLASQSGDEEEDPDNLDAEEDEEGDSDEADADDVEDMDSDDAVVVEDDAGGEEDDGVLEDMESEELEANQEQNSTLADVAEQMAGLLATAQSSAEKLLQTLPEWPIGRVWAAACVFTLVLVKFIGCGCSEQRQGANRLLRQRLWFTLLALLVLGGLARVAQQSGQLPEVWLLEASEAIMAFVAAGLALIMVVLLSLRAVLFRRWSVYEQQGVWEPFQATTDEGGRVRLKRNPKTCRYWAMKASFQEQCGLPDNFLFAMYLSESFMMSTMNLMELSFTSFFTILLPAVSELGIHFYFARHFDSDAGTRGLQLFAVVATYSTLMLHVHMLLRINAKVLPVIEHPGSRKVEPEWVQGVRRMAQALTVFDLIEVSNFGAQMWHGIGPFAAMSSTWLLLLGLPLFANLFVMIPLIIEWLSFIEACDAPHEEIIEFVSSHLGAPHGEETEEIASALGISSIAPLHQLFMKCEPDKDGVVQATDFFQRMKEQYFAAMDVDGDEDDPLVPRKAG
eukprot:CAMPEP_0178431768 /NCGR_PEP_ID=MMETSP0689_2-20121128/32031_1 /TAXON_ID=160604 /ORGANISM="Amphidinium massartii, Strain CS-259" /LENGTH=553 /DNA_ID=CAMNT_0020053717 /DNA_START=259 /DNA_END=1920 /DNA_ORIENTATION=-